jgi:four helix bundle protein
MEYGYEKLIAWKNCVTLRRNVFEITKNFPPNEYRRVSQMRDSARSMKQNIQEG